MTNSDAKMMSAVPPSQVLANAFNGDSHIARAVANLVTAFGVELIIETGTYHGDTTAYLSTLVKRVITMEVDLSAITVAAGRLAGCPNVLLMKCNSPDGISALDYAKYNSLFFLDAHWPEYCPLADELRAIAAKALKPVIVIHDFKVPGRPDLGYDSYNGQDYEFTWIKPLIDDIYGVGQYTHSYNTIAEGARRGVLYITPLA